MNYQDENQNQMNFGDDFDDIPIVPKRKKSTSSASSESRRTTVKQGEKLIKNDKKRKRHNEKNDKRRTALSNPDSAFNISMVYVCVFVAIYFAFCLYSKDTGASVGKVIRFVLFGLFSSAAYAIPPFLLLQGVTWRYDIKNKILLRKVISTFVALLFISALIYLPKNALQGKTFENAGAFIASFFNWNAPVENMIQGGLLGSLLGWCLYNSIGKVGTVLVFILVLLLYLIFFFNFNPKTFAIKAVKFIKIKLSGYKGKRAAKKTAVKEKALVLAEESSESVSVSVIEEDKPKAHARRVRRPYQPDAALSQEATDVSLKNNSSSFDSDNSYENESPLLNGNSVIESPTADETEFSRFSQGSDEHSFSPKTPSVEMIEDSDDDEASATQSMADIRKITKFESTPNKNKIPRVSTKSTNAVNDTDSDDDDEENDTFEPKAVKSAPKASEKPKGYTFPPYTLLEKSQAIQDSLLNAESDPVAIKLRQTLKNFNVNTTISNVSRGPRITRYELVPDTGIRIRAIANLVDDISMALATAGIRIEAPIPGKAAVGVEVPNASPVAVRLRSLLDCDTFKNAPAKTTICLGSDIAGDAVYADLAKMPHMLIAGATGMGKSVCINTIITSILYKARPDEVKLILIDPKKVELNVYSGIPHLLIPVVSDPSQAAGALAWAVNEMESRFDRIEAEGVRNIKGYNKAIENDPTKEPMCQIVIIIDELADLMMSSPDSVETSICRIAQKARAAGIHLIIGTQRPSVDVITGLIKANIPSRIAFHVSSQIDSRTILDTAGAEKLLNNGDMLFYPAGIPKPKRIQGAFVDDDEVERVTTFLKKNSNGATYDDVVMEEIKKAAEKCAQNGKRKNDSDSEDGSVDGILDDPKFQDAVEIAFDANKISTSLLQRKLSIGFGKAARYIDAMCEMGIVSEPDGQKPREVLMTRSEYYERQNRLSD